jgi:uncharacterized protein
MTIKKHMSIPFHIEKPLPGLTIVQVAPGATVPPHSHHEGYIVVPFAPSSAERVTHENGKVVNREALMLFPLVPYYVEPTKKNQTISLVNTGKRISPFQKFIPQPPIKGPQPELSTEPMTIIGQSSNRYVFTVEIALTLVQQAVGLMFRPALGPDRGMLFVWSEPREVAMYMRNTLVPLDILFIDSTFTISRIHENAVPGDPTPIPSRGEVILTLEIPGGTAARLGIKKGDAVQ